jgi:lipopolysaccharide/colanic/teichoic acid biosynthesis glycosyltransferase
MHVRGSFAKWRLGLTKLAQILGVKRAKSVQISAHVDLESLQMEMEPGGATLAPNGR